jgi:hypothetical protein
MPFSEEPLMRQLVPAALVFALACSSSHVSAPDGSTDASAPDAGDGCPTDHSAALGTSCADEGRFCGRCIDPCGFCNILQCSGGTWTRLEAHPPPPPCVSFECGPDRRCDAVTQYCERVNSDVGGEPTTYACEPYPDGCSSCDCLPGDRCEGDAATGITITYLGG